MTLLRPRSLTAHPGAHESRLHLGRMTGPLGLYQHATGRDPALRHGYCTDDNARLLIVDLRHAQRWADIDISRAIDRDLGFLEQAFSVDRGRFRNMRSVDGAWLDAVGTEDSHGRAIQALGWAMATARDEGVVRRARRLLERALPATSAFQHPRPMAYTVLGCLRGAAAQGDGDLFAVARETAGRLAATMPGDADWPWPEPVVTYDNGVVPQTLIEAGDALDMPALVDRGTACLDWLMAGQLLAGHLRPVGNLGWWPRGGSPARYDQQPIEAASLLEASRAAFRATGHRRYAAMAATAFAWFVGDNDLATPLADPSDGSCRDGLGADGPSQNRGAESTLAWLMSVETMADA